MSDAVTPRPAATVVLVRDGQQGMEILLAEKTQKVNFAAGAFVFPGGAVDVTDSPKYFGQSIRLATEYANQRLGITTGAIDYWIAAIRECFEEVGVLFSRPKQNPAPDSATDTEMLRTRLRAQMLSGDCEFHELLNNEGLDPAVDDLHYLSHWITQAGRPRRYDTRFFIARVPDNQPVSHDGGELVSHRWLTAKEALNLNSQGEINLMFPTHKTLEQLLEFKSVDEAIDYAKSDKPMKPMNPKVSVGVGGKKLLLPGDFAYTEVSKLDPLQKGTASREIHPNEPVAIHDGVIRLTASNSSVMTGPGTNTYILGNQSDGYIVIDPGPNETVHLELIRELTKDCIDSVVCTHTHLDHSPGATYLKQNTGAKLVGSLPKFRERQDTTFIPDIDLHDGLRLARGDAVLNAIHTPGHASNHFCFLMDGSQILFTGDHIMQGSTVVINPPDGDMTQYLKSLRRLTNFEVNWVAPGHGFLMDSLPEIVDRLLIHRRKRELKIISAMQRLESGALGDIVTDAYDDVDEKLHALAQRSLLAHLIKLESEGRVQKCDETWGWLG